MSWLIKAQKLFYHGSPLHFPIGFILKPQNTGYVHDEKEIEDIVERYRPPDKISRFQAVFMVDNPELIDYAGGYEDFMYIVEPIGQIDKSDLSWYTDVSVYLDASPEEQKEWSFNYWNGVPYKNPANSLWEYRAREAEVVKLL